MVLERVRTRHVHRYGATLPAWLRASDRAAPAQAKRAVSGLLDELELNTVCQSAKCPNRSECFSAGTATFLIMGDACTRGCRFCAVETRQPAPLDPDEPERVAEAAARMGLAPRRHHLGHPRRPRGRRRRALRRHHRSGSCGGPGCGDRGSHERFRRARERVSTAVAAALPDVYNHNLETVPRLYAEVRPGAAYDRSLRVLATRTRDAAGPAHQVRRHARLRRDAR